MKRIKTTKGILDLLDKAIKSWALKAKGKKGFPCPLCTYITHIGCDGCPIYIDVNGCDNTPCFKYLRPTNIHEQKLKYAKEELAYLKGLRKRCYIKGGK